MKYLKLFKNFRIESSCRKYRIKKYTINSEGLVDVDGYVKISNIKLNFLPIKFGKVVGNFDCSLNELTSLEGCPKEVRGDFNCSYNLLSSLKGCPKVVGGNFVCNSNKLTSLEGCPDEVGGDFLCYSNQLTIIDYLPECIEGHINLIGNKIRDIKVEDKNYKFFGKCYLNGNPIDDLFKYWEGNLQNFIIELEFEDFIRDDGKSVDMLRFEYALDGKEYNKRSIKNYKLIWNK